MLSDELSSSSSSELSSFAGGGEDRLTIGGGVTFVSESDSSEELSIGVGEVRLFLDPPGDQAVGHEGRQIGRSVESQPVVVHATLTRIGNSRCCVVPVSQGN